MDRADTVQRAMGPAGIAAASSPTVARAVAPVVTSTVTLAVRVAAARVAAVRVASPTNLAMEVRAVRGPLLRME